MAPFPFEVSDVLGVGSFALTDGTNTGHYTATGVSASATVVPEPTTALLLSFGLATLASLRRRHAKA